MPSIHRSALVAHSAEAMFNLVNDVESYPKFLPGCADSKILNNTEQAMSASLLVSKAGIKQWFTTENVLYPAERIEMQLVDGPFRSLSGGWTFSALSDEACKIELNLHFEFANKLAEMAFGKVFNSLASSMVTAFTERAKSVYA
ncbi:MAG: type II toxin-antitoxin system RatA family toxin [Alteromonas sp.]|jgi:ribosome-associated toxin RatA of RatAB toxin-antitoxin module|uniref:Ubiquinone-binding protein n=1 Tax=Alteromonas genovensis TaxID=471225 RepID=A0A6N9TLR4_9ALTE|nr:MULTISPECIES: type II toxin-antitoxin system RatA family toxin [Alteromonas]MAI39310.1 ubiquinone-binding protein [Alteromonas sp.]NDW16469.1 ubiquinone-binding protein [Alteromonas genovensis]OUX84198.1 MAG: ubiquinone-binding protein [Alteromonas sp. TMED35]|tara:strand:+ start:2162 stop:2593 length:432 start_codon:yes stop_codon:yes gene_type:complete